ncbi:AAA family ATPase [Nostoc sp. NIES-2111]
MGTEHLLDLLYQRDLSEFEARHEKAFGALFGAQGGRYPDSARKVVKTRINAQDYSQGVPFAAYIHPEAPERGSYGGTSFVVIPSPESAALFGLVVGTQGLAPDHALLGRPGHSRKARAICDWLQSQSSEAFTAWSKHDPTRTDLELPAEVTEAWSPFAPSIRKYGSCLYAMYRANDNREATHRALRALLDLYFQERGQGVVASQRKDAEAIQYAWASRLMPKVESSAVAELLRSRKYVVLQGPPGCGKTHMSLELLASAYRGKGKTIQFHPSSTYESFLGGLAPESTATDLGLRFSPKPGILMEAARESMQVHPEPYLLHIDEINRADLAKVLGEAIFLLEAQSAHERSIQLAHDFGPPWGNEFSLPPNLHILGTMNSADRSIAILDVAVRRRFAFVSLWPRPEVIETTGVALMKEAFARLQRLFVEYASDDALALLPGHAYFLVGEGTDARQHLQSNLLPLLEEYLAQGYVNNFAESLRTYNQWLRAL